MREKFSEATMTSEWSPIPFDFFFSFCLLFDKIKKIRLMISCHFGFVTNIIGIWFGFLCFDFFFVLHSDHGQIEI